MDSTYDLQEELDFLDSKDVRIYLDEFEDLTLETGDGSVYQSLTAVRAFPLTSPDRFITIKNEDGSEIGTIGDISNLGPESRSTLLEVLDRSYFIPMIETVIGIEARFNVPEWSVETDRGPRTFEIRSSRRDIRILNDGKILIRDADGNRFLIPDYRRLEPKSRALVESQI